MAIVPFFKDGQTLYTLDYIKSDAVKPNQYTIVKTNIIGDIVEYEIASVRRYGTVTWKESFIVDRIRNNQLYDNKIDALRKLVIMHENEKTRAKQEYDYQVEKHDKKIANLQKQIGDGN